MKALRSAMGRLSGAPIQIIVTALLLLIGVGAGGTLLFNYFRLTRSIDTDFSPAAQRLPQLASLRNTVVQLDAAVEFLLGQDVPDFSRTDQLRSSLEGGTFTMKAYAADDPDYQKVFDAVSTLLTIYDKNMDALRANKGVLKPTVRFELQRSFGAAEIVLDAVYQRQQTTFLLATTSTLNQIRAIQFFLVAVGIVVLALGATLIFSIRRASRRETLLASGRLQVAAEIGQAAASVLSLDQLFETTLNLINQRFGYAFASVFLIEEKGEYAVMRAGTGEAGKNLITAGHKVLVGSNSTIGFVTFNGRSMVYSEMRRQTEYFKNELVASTRSELAVPLRLGGQVIGALDVQSLELDPFADADTTVMQTLADQIAVAIGNASEFTREQARARQMAALSQASARLSGPQISLPELLTNVVQHGRGLLATDDIGVWMPAGADELELKASANPAEQLGRRLRQNEGVSGEAFRTGKPVRIEDYARWSGRSQRGAASGIQSAMAVPLLWQERPVGTLTLTRAELHRPFTADDEQIAVLYASQIASALENNRLIQETQDRVDELYTLNQIGQAIAAQSDLRSLFDVVRREVTRSMSARTFYIAVYDASAGTIELPYMFDNGAIDAIPPYPLGEGFTSQIIQTRRALKIDNAEEALALGPKLSGQPAQSFLGVPVLVADQVLGALAVQDVVAANAYNDADVRLLTTIAGQVGLAMQNLRLLEQTRRRAAELATLNRITNTAITVRELEKILGTAAAELVAIFKARNCGIALFDAAGQTATVVADANRDPHEASARGVTFPVEGNDSTQQVIATGRGLVITSPQTHPLTGPLHDLMRERRTTALMILPLSARGKVIGTVGIDSDEPGRTFLAGEQELAETLVAPLSTAIDNNQLLEETRKRADQLAAAAEVSRAATATLEPDELIIRATDLIRERFELYYAATFIVDDANQWANLRYATGEAGQTLMANRHRLAVGGQSMVGTAISTRQARIALDVGAEKVRFNNPYLPDTRSEMALPLAAGNEIIGAIDVQSTVAGAFSESDVTALQTMANQIAVAIQNARSFTATQRRMQTEELLVRLSNRLRTAQDVDAIMKAALDELQTALGARRIIAQLGPQGSPVFKPTGRGTGRLRRRDTRPLVAPADGNGANNGNGHNGGGPAGHSEN